MTVAGLGEIYGITKLAKLTELRQEEHEEHEAQNSVGGTTSRSSRTGEGPSLRSCRICHPELVEGSVQLHHLPVLPEFLNVDLEIESKQSLDILAQQFGDKVHLLYNDYRDDGTYLLSLEIYSGDDHDPDSIVNAFCDLISNLSGRAKILWRKASARRFDIGIASGLRTNRNSKALRLVLAPKTLERISALSAEIVVTVYPLRSVPKPKKK
jgi:hypothetical protein